MKEGTGMKIIIHKSKVLKHPFLKKNIAAIFLAIVILLASACKKDRIETLTYAVFPYLPDTNYYQELIESRWAELEPNIKLVRAKWDCYFDGNPNEIDIVMYDAVMRDTLLSSGWINPINQRDIQNKEDIVPFALEGFTVGNNLYGIPIFLCGNFLIYDRNSKALSDAEHITDLSDKSEILVVNIEDSMNRPQYVIEAIADTLGDVNPSSEFNVDEIMNLLDHLAIDGHKKDDNEGVAMAYDAGIGDGYIGYSESICLLKKRFDQTRIKSISFSDKENIPRLYSDAVAITSKVKGERYEKCLKLMNIMAESEILTSLSIKNNLPQCLLLARKSPYEALRTKFPIYEELEKLACNERNHVILTP